MTKTLVEREFTSNDRNPNANGSQRLLVVTETDGQVRMVISGVQGTGLNTRTVVLSDETVSLATWETYKNAILGALPR